MTLRKCFSNFTCQIWIFYFNMVKSCEHYIIDCCKTLVKVFHFIIKLFSRKILLHNNLNFSWSFVICKVIFKYFLLYIVNSISMFSIFDNFYLFYHASMLILLSAIHNRGNEHKRFESVSWLASFVFVICKRACNYRLHPTNYHFIIQILQQLF